MADTRLSDLSAAGALSASDLFYVVQTPGSGGEKATGTQLLTLVGTSYLAKAGGTMTGALTIASGTLTASAPGLNVTQTWNAGAVGFVGALIDITNTASAGASYPLLIKVGGISMFEFTKAGRLNSVQVSTGILQCTYADFGSSGDTLLYRDAAATLAQRNGTTQQIFRLYNTYTDSSNYERLTLTGVAGTSVNITAETLGTGGDNLDFVISPAGTGIVRLGANATITGTGFITAVGLRTSTTSGLDYYGTGLRVSSAAEVAWTDGAASGTKDTALFRGAAGQVDVTNGTAATYRDLKLRNLLQTEYSQLTEMTAPAAPAANSVRIYAEDNGAGKTRLMALFATGAAQQIAIEP